MLFLAYAVFFFILCIIIFGLSLNFFLTLLLYKHKSRYVNLAFHIGASLPCYLFLFRVSDFLILFLIFIVSHLAFTLYAVFYARKTDKQKLTFRKNLIRYIASFFIGIIFTIASCAIVYAIGAFIWYQEFYYREIYHNINYFIALAFGIIVILFSQIIYKNHKPFFTKLFHKIQSVIRKNKPQ